MSPYIGYDSDTTFIPGTLNTSSSLTIQGGGITQTGGDVNFDSGTLFIDEDLNRVGIGITTPIRALDVYSNGSTDIVKFSNDSGTSITLGTYAGMSTWDVPASTGFRIRSGGSSGEYLTISSTGNVGIGDSTPGVKLEVVGTTTSGLRIKSAESNSRGLELWNDGVNDICYVSNYYSGPLILQTANTERLRIVANGNVGIGTTNPVAKLNIYNSGADASAIFKSDTWGSELSLDAGNGYAALKILASGTEKWRVGLVGQTSNLQFWQTGTGERLTITSSGNVGIGTTNPAAKLHIFNSTLDSTLLYLQGNNNYNYEFRTKTGPNLGGQRLDSFIGSSGAEWSFTDGDNIERLRIKSSGEEGLYVRKGIEVSNSTSVSLLLSRNNAEVTKQHFYVHSNNSPWYLYGENLTWTSERSGTTRRANKPYYEAFAPAIGIKEFGFVNKTTADTSFVSTDLVPSLTLHNNGNVGIGTTNPGTKLDVDGIIRLTASGNYTTYATRLYSRLDSTHCTVLESYLNSSSAFELIGSYADNGGVNPRVVISAGGQNVGIGITNPSYKLEVNGSFAATTKSFIIPHPTKEGYKLRYGSLEGPENGVYVRGRGNGSVIELPDYWVALVDPDSITVSLTPIGSNMSLGVERIENNRVYIFSEDPRPLDYFYMINAERVDVESLEVEIPPTN